MLDEPACRSLAATCEVARLATLRPDGRIDLVPIVFAFTGECVVFAVDHKPKTRRSLQRLTNIEANPGVTVLFDHYTGDWGALWWVRMRGHATVRRSDPAARSALVSRYEQYVAHPPAGPFVRVVATEWRGWSASDGPRAGFE